MSLGLLDTQALLWFLDASPRLSDVARQHITQPGVELFFSHASAWEIAIKHASGKLSLPASPEPFLTEQLTLNRIRLLPISIGSIFQRRPIAPSPRGSVRPAHRHPVPASRSHARLDRRRLRCLWRPPGVVKASHR